MLTGNVVLGLTVPEDTDTSKAMRHGNNPRRIRL